ncbi:MAG: glycosyltransferase [Candidatus Margulisbacteria bacterium]|jgi:glycosyltransferase involved in cell wall biosynthesis|nr:glycosyltransferase [Candidatus Margulisiibacteriota bacterium]
MLTYIPHHVPLKSQANQGAFIRTQSLVDFVRSLPGGRVVIPSRLCFDPLTGLLLILGTIRFTRNKYILLSYPNLPFFDANPVNQFFFNLFIRAARSLCRAGGKRLILDADDIPSLSEPYLRKWPQSPRRLARLKRMEQELLNGVDVIWTITDGLAQAIGQAYGIPREKFVLAPNGNLRLNLKPKLPPGDAIRVIYAGAFFWAGIKEMLLSFTRLRTGRTIEFYLLGPYAEWLPSFLAQLNDRRIKFLGALNHPECEAIVRSCQVGVLCYDPAEKYYSLAHPVKLSLYITSGVPVVTTDIGAAAALVKKEELGLVSSFPDMTPALQRMIEDAALRDRCAANCRRISEDYYFDRIYRRALAESEQVLRRKEQ